METGQPAHGSLKAILIGSVVDQGGSWMVGSFVGAVLSVVLGGSMPGASAEDLRDFVAESAPLTMAFVVTGAACSFVGAYVAARLAPSAASAHALAVGLLGIVIPSAWLDELPPRWAQIASTVLIIALSLLAARIVRQGERRAGPPARPPAPPRFAPPPVPAQPPPAPQPSAAPQAPGCI